MKTADVRPEVLAVIRRFKAQHGRRWKSKLWAFWQKAEYPGSPEDDKAWLQYARNAYGPTWLDKLKASDLES